MSHTHTHKKPFYCLRPFTVLMQIWPGGYVTTHYSLQWYFSPSLSTLSSVHTCFVFNFIFKELWSDVVCSVYLFDKYKKYYCVSHWVTSHYTTIAISSLFFFSFFPFLFFFIFLYYKNLKVKNGFQPANCNLCQNCFTILN